MAKLFKIFIILVVVGIIAASIYSVIRHRNSKGDKIKLIEVKRGEITEKALAVGQIEPRLKFQVKSKISGIVKRCVVNVGDKVKAGDALFEIAPDPTPSQLIEVDRTLDSAKASFKKTDADYQRYRKLYSQGIVSSEDLGLYRERYELAGVALDKARQNRELTIKGRVSGGGAAMETVIRAPAAGTILSRSVDPGDPVVPLTAYQAGTQLASIARMNDLIFKGTVDEIDVGKMKVGLPARIKVGALPSDIVTGHVSRIAPEAEKAEGATLFNIEIELNPGQKITLRAGYSANAEVVIKEEKNVLTIPERLVHFEKGGKKAYVDVPGATSKAKTRKVDVKLGLSDGLNVEILSGLKEGDKVVELPPKEIS